jgi:DNA modification methylase
MNKWICGDAVEEMHKMARGSVDGVVADPPYSDFDLINHAVDEALRVAKGTVAFFMYAEDLVHLKHEPDRCAFWVKPISTKNTVNNYSRFVEVIALYRVKFVRKLHWACRSGIFTDSLIEEPKHLFGKPESLIERLLLNHVPAGGHVLDPFAGSGTVSRVATKLGMNCTSIEIDSKWNQVHTK